MLRPGRMVNPSPVIMRLSKLTHEVPVVVVTKPMPVMYPMRPLVEALPIRGIDAVLVPPVPLTVKSFHADALVSTVSVRVPPEMAWSISVAETYHWPPFICTAQYICMFSGCQPDE